MTDAHTPAVLRDGPLTADMVPLLKAGSSVLRLDGDCAGFVAGDLFTYAGCDNVLPRRVQLYDKAGQPPKTWAISRFTYIGERDADGWITAPEGGWNENPVPRAHVYWQTRNEPDAADCETLVPSEALDWLPVPRQRSNPPIIAFRLSDQPVENSPISALGGTEAEGRSAPIEVTIFCPVCAVPHIDEGEWATTRHHKTHQCQSCGHEWRPFPFATVGVAHPQPPPVRGLEPVAWRYRWPEWSAALPWHTMNVEPSPETREKGCVVEPLYSASDVSALQGKLADAEKLIGTFVKRYGDMQDGNGNTPTEIRRAKRFLEALEQQQ